MSSVCFTLRHIFQPYLDIDVRINCDANPSRLKRKLAALDANLARISSIEVFTEIPLLSKSLSAIPEPRVLNPRTKYIISAFLRNAACMPRLHTATFSRIIMDQEHLELVFHSKSLHTLIFDHCSLRGMHPPFGNETCGRDGTLSGALLCQSRNFTYHFSPCSTRVASAVLYKTPGLPKAPKIRFRAADESADSINRSCTAIGAL